MKLQMIDVEGNVLDGEVGDVIFDTSVNSLLSLTGQTLSLNIQEANKVFIGPVFGDSAIPTFRYLIASDIPVLPYEASGAIATHAALLTGVHGLAITADKTLTITDNSALNQDCKTTATPLFSKLKLTDLEIQNGNGVRFVYGNFTTWNFSIGFSTLDSTTGGRNFALGPYALQYTTVGVSNIGIGPVAGRFANGQYNVFIGESCGRGVLGESNGNFNTCFGSGSGYSLTTGSSNLFLGTNAGFGQTTGSNQFIVDNQGRANDQTDALLYGLFNATPANQTLRCNGKIGVNVNPLEEIHAADTVRADTVFNINGTDGATQVASAGTVVDTTAIVGGIVTAKTQVTPIVDGTVSLVGKTSITFVNGRVTALS